MVVSLSTSNSEYLKSNPLIHLLRQSLLLLLILFAADRTLGWWLEHTFYLQKHGDDVVTRYTLDSTREDLLVFGSSRASHHYNTLMLDSLLDMSVYNCGRDEMGITYTSGVIPYAFERKAPKCIIVEVLPTELSGVGKATEIQRISTRLIPFAHRHPGLWPTVAAAGKMEVYKAAVSKIYPYNSLIGSIIQNTYTNLVHQTIRGFEPLHGAIDSATFKPTHWMNMRELTGIDSALKARMIFILDYAREHGTQAIVVISPFYYSLDIAGNESHEMLPELAAKHGAFFLDWSQDPRFLMHPKLFYDDVHLNETGARLYTQIIADTLKKLGISGVPK